MILIYYFSDVIFFWYDVYRCVVYRRNDGFLIFWNVIDICVKIVMDLFSEYVWEFVNCLIRFLFMCNKGYNICKIMILMFIKWINLEFVNIVLI